MKNSLTRVDRLLRLKKWLWWRPHKYHSRVRPGGWITLHPALGIKPGDQFELELRGQTLVLRLCAKK